MIKFNEIIKYAQDYANAIGPKKIAVANAQDEDVLKAIKEAVNENICKPILVGDTDKITELAKTVDLELNNIDIIDEKDGNKAC
ncbi:phosphate acyltransferase, partial [Sedimentibacter sp.]